MKIMLDEGAYMPTRAHSTDAGLDLYSPVDVMIMPQANAVIDTGVHVELPPGSVGFLKSKSLPDLEQVDRLEDTERGCGGFGSTGR